MLPNPFAACIRTWASRLPFHLSVSLGGAPVVEPGLPGSPIVAQAHSVLDPGERQVAQEAWNRRSAVVPPAGRVAPLTPACARPIQADRAAVGAEASGGSREQAKGGGDFLAPRAPGRGFGDVERLEIVRIAWFNQQRVSEPLGNLPPTEGREQFHRFPSTSPVGRALNTLGFLRTQGGSTLGTSVP